MTESGRATLVDGGPITATDDVAYLLDMAPGASFVFGAGGPGAVPHHHPAFEIDERAIGLMSEILARAAIKSFITRPACRSGPREPEQQQGANPSPFDVLPSGGTGVYWANGIELGSTLFR